MLPNCYYYINTKDPTPPSALIKVLLWKQKANNAINTSNHSNNKVLPLLKRYKGFKLILTIGVTRKSAKGVVLRWGKKL